MAEIIFSSPSPVAPKRKFLIVEQPEKSKSLLSMKNNLSKVSLSIPSRTSPISLLNEICFSFFSIKIVSFLLESIPKLRTIL